MPWSQIYDPLDNPALSTVVATLPIVVLLGSIALCLTAAMISFRKVASIDPALVFRT